VPRLLITTISILAAFSLAVMSMVPAAGNALRNRAPVAAASLPGETRADVEIMNALLLAGKKVPAAQARATAKAALKDDPLNSSALRLLMSGTEGAKLSPAKLRLANLAGRVSRRDGVIRLLLFEQAARTNQPTAALDNIDAILRVTPESQAKMFPVLKALLADADFRKHLSPYLVKRSLWSLEFVLFAANDEIVVDQVADVVVRAGKGMAPSDIALVAPPLITRAMEARQFSHVPALLSFLTKDADAVMNGERWTNTSVDSKYGLAAWQTASNATTSVSFVGDGDGDSRKLSLYAASGAAGSVASKYLFLKPGPYQLRHELELSDGDRKDQALQWRLACLAGTEDRTVWTSANLLASGPRELKFGFEVPPGCSSQRLELSVAVDFQATVLEATLDNFRLTRMLPK
jgi:hypothetical protein